MKRHLIKTIILAVAIMFSIGALAACELKFPNSKRSYDVGVVKAFNAVTPQGDVVSQTATADGQKYLVTVITPSSVCEYKVGSEFKVEDSTAIVGNIALAAEVVEENTISDLERAFDVAVQLSGIPKDEVVGFDFDRDTYMGKSVFKVKIEDVVAEYSYTLDVSDLSLIKSETELKNAQSSSESSYIGEQRAREIALEAVGTAQGKTINFGEVINYALKSVMVDGRRVYKVSFDYDGYRYSVDIDALKGDIVEFSKTINDENVSNPDIPDIISQSEAKDIAIGFAFPDGVGNNSIAFRKVKLEYEKGKFIYEVEFFANKVENNSNQGFDYEFEISALNGEILDVEIKGYDAWAEDDNDAPQYDNPQYNAPQGKFITREQAEKNVLDKVGADALVIDVEIDSKYSNGERRYFYEVEIRVNGREVEYYVDAITGSVTLNEEYSGNTVAPSLTEEEALNKALSDFELTADELTYKRIKLERDDGRLCYEIKLKVGNTEYSMTIDANSGTILEREIEVDDDVPPQSSDEFITPEQAAEAVKKAVTGNVRVKEVELDDEGYGENRRYYYEVEVEVDGREYDYYVDAITGEVRLKGELVDGNKNLIGEEQAISIALDYFSLTKSQVRVSKAKLEEEDGILVYEVEFKVRDIEYTAILDAQSGKVLESDISYD